MENENLEALSKLFIFRRGYKDNPNRFEERKNL